ncbi:fungal-specific transcription factor domain-containing protein [Amylocystis lapponica]|nr:fungal-specific transcription factor domain-containing protein [Amylocystis lapponica]
MEGTPVHDGDPSSHSTMIPYPHSSPPSSGQSALGHDQSMLGHAQASSQPKFSNGPHIRSRITVVCAECKRLKLKCDRRTPCSSCLKRDTVQRCVYSQAAAEKIDVQSLHNRILVLESTLAQISSASPSTPLSAALGGMPPFKAPFNGTGVPQAPSSNGTSRGVLAGLPCNDRALLAIGTSGSSVVISLEDVASIWLNELDDPGVEGRSSSSADGNGSSARSSGSSGSRVKLEPTPVLLPPAPQSSSASRGSTHTGRSCSTSFVPPLPYETFLPTTLSPLTHVSTPANPFPPANSYMSSNDPPQVTSALLNRLPSAESRKRFLKALDETMQLHPCFNVRILSSAPSTNDNEGSRSMQELAQELFFPASTTNGKTSRQGKDARSLPQLAGTPKPTLSFFAAASAALALGALVVRGDAGGNDVDSSSSAPGATAEGVDGHGSPAALLALSDQALGLFEKTALYDLDSVIAMLLQVLYHLHDGQMSVAQGVFPLVGKMINVARMMGLAIDPDEFSGAYSLFEAETRRRIWWDVFYYDLFISDCMGHPPLIADNSFTTRFPADVDEEQFSPSSTVLPAPPGGENSEKSTAYFVQKCRLAQLVKNVKKQTFRDPLDNDELSIDQATAFEAEVASWLSELPPSFRLEMDHDLSEPVPPLPSTSPLLLAQRCELAILANRLILKLYLPFLKEGKPFHQAVLGTINAAHLVIYASRMLHAVWRTACPAAFNFYDFGRTLFDAAVICAHAVIQQPTSILAPEAMKGLSCALDVMRELGTQELVGEAIKIVEMMKRKAEAARSANSSSTTTIAGTKRKRSALEGDSLSSNFQLPFVGAAVASAKPGQAKSLASPSKSSNAAQKETAGHDPIHKPDAKKHAPEKKDKDKDKDKDKATKYPPVGIRVRPGQPPPSRQRTASVTTPGPVHTHSNVRMNGPTSGVGPPPPSHPPQQQQQQHRVSVAQSPSVPVYESYPSSRPSPHGGAAHEPMQHDDYPMQYSAGDDLDRRRYSSQPFVDSPSAAALFDQASLSHPSPSSYSTGPTPPNYYMSYTPSAGPSQGYDAPPMSHPHMVGMGVSAAPSPMDPPGSVGNIAPSMSSLQRDQDYLGQEKPHPSYPPHLNKPHDHGVPRPIPHEYHPPPNLPPMTMSNGSVAGWAPADQSSNGEMWTPDYKYYSV